MKFASRSIDLSGAKTRGERSYDYDFNFNNLITRDPKRLRRLRNTFTFARQEWKLEIERET